MANPVSKLPNPCTIRIVRVSHLLSQLHYEDRLSDERQRMSMIGLSLHLYKWQEVRFCTMVVQIDDGVGGEVRVMFPGEVVVMEVISLPSELYLIASEE